MLPAQLFSNNTEDSNLRKRENFIRIEEMMVIYSRKKMKLEATGIYIVQVNSELVILDLDPNSNQFQCEII